MNDEEKMSDEFVEEDDVEVELDDKGVPKLPRIYFSIPYKYRREFYEYMQEQYRKPGDLLRAIFLEHMDTRRLQIAAERARSKQPGGERRRLPYFGPRPPQLNADQAGEQTLGEA